MKQENVAYRSCNKCKWNNGYASQQSPLNNPYIFFTGSFSGPIKPIAITMCEKAANSHRPAWDI
ncbi:MAG: hypothetical protein H7320_13850 [Ferruginibacter sp.]|nr:hypothetical protein [Ferruginibacter sp.]